MPCTVTASLSEGVTLLRDGRPVARWTDRAAMGDAAALVLAWRGRLPVEGHGIVELSRAEQRALVLALVETWEA